MTGVPRGDNTEDLEPQAGKENIGEGDKILVTILLQLDIKEITEGKKRKEGEGIRRIASMTITKEIGAEIVEEDEVIVAEEDTGVGADTQMTQYLKDQGSIGDINRQGEGGITEIAVKEVIKGK